jgi:hypothetical protein
MMYVGISSALTVMHFILVSCSVANVYSILASYTEKFVADNNASNL